MPGRYWLELLQVTIVPDEHLADIAEIRDVAVADPPVHRTLADGRRASILAAEEWTTARRV